MPAPPSKDGPRINEDIRVPRVLLIDQNGEKQGIMPTSAALGARAALAVGNDTGVLHLIAAAGAPTIALFSGASDPAVKGPRGHVTVLHSPALKDLPVDTVAHAALALAQQPA